MNYRLIKFSWDTEPHNVIRDNGNGTTTSIPFDPANTDYVNFKYQIDHDEAQLEDADGNVMSPEAAKAYVATLP